MARLSFGREERYFILKIRKWSNYTNLERETSLHYNVIDFLLHLADGPIQAAELQDPAKVEDKMDTEDVYEAEIFEYNYESQFDPSQWKDDSTLSDWSDDENSKQVDEKIPSKQQRSSFNLKE